ncbi:MAG: radical SAM protein [Acidimicrobiales bacterium]|nr:radical SAM protein [Acidimicrobiales bacterium]MCB9393735.1 radical SAM protein [Acidimicrobiaceae bacterium]
MKYSRFNIWSDQGASSAGGHEVGVYCGVSGALQTMTRRERDLVDAFVSGRSEGDGVEALLEHLVRMGAIVHDEADELATLRRRYDDSRWRSDSLGYTIVTSLGCNFDCPYCFEDKHPSLLKPEVADALVGVLRDSMPGIRRLDVTWMGGEPLLGARQLFDLAARFIDLCDEHERTYTSSIITNGWYLDGAMAERLAAHRVRSAQVTIDGPPDIHDVKRPHAGGGPTFERILRNVAEAADLIDVQIRINVDTANAHRVAELVDRLAEEGLAGRVGVALGRITDAVSNDASPLASYTKSCLTASQFSHYELAFQAVAEAAGFGYPGLPQPSGSPCTAVRSREIVVGADGEMWKCWDDIGDPARSIGTVFDYRTTNQELDRWLAYHPLDDAQCSSCMALPVCMGGCAHHDFHSDDREAKCGSFRTNHQRRVDEVTRRRLGFAAGEVAPLPRFDLEPAGPLAGQPVTMRPTRRGATASAPLARVS